MGTVFLHGNGGSGGSGGGLGLQVVGNPKPKNPTEGIVWVNTDVDITGYFLSAEQPENLAEGNLWIKISDSSNIKVGTPLGKDYITINLDSVSQYIGGELVSVKAKRFQNGVWVDLVDWVATYFYRYGDECASNGGAWTNSGYSRSGYTLLAPTKTGSYMLVKGNGSGTANGFAGKEKTINLTDINSITAIVENVAGESGYMMVMSSKSFSAPTNAAAYVMISTEQTKQTVTLDVSELTGNYYLAFMSGISNNSGFKILEVYA